MYKITQNSKVLDIVQNPNFVRFLPTGQVAFTNKSLAEGIVSSDNSTVYSFIPHPKFLTVSIEKITLDEFNRLNSLLNSEEAVYSDDTVLIDTRLAAINRLANTSKANIVKGFSIKLSDGLLHHFKLTSEDQLNLLQMELQLMAGETSFVYHSTGNPCQVFLQEDMNKIVKAFKNIVKYHTTYFNTAKQYINSLTDLDAIERFSYGMDISEFANNLAVKKILKTGVDI